MSQPGAGRNVMVQGRIVWTSGNLFTGRIKTVFGTTQPKLDPKTGEKKTEYGFGLAVPKSVLAQSGPGQPGEIWAALYAEAMTMFPNGQVPPSFAMKFKDGDGLDDEGKPFNLREGYAGHIVLACTTEIPIKWFRYENGANILINEGVKCGDYVNAQLTIKAHGAIGAGKAGLYVNPNAVQFLGYGKEIINMPSGDQIFGQGMPNVPQGASATPLVPQAGFLQPPGAPVGTFPPQGFGQSPMNHGGATLSGPPAPTNAFPSNQPVMPPAPHFGVLPQNHQPPPGGQPMGNGYPPPQMFPAPVAVPTPMAGPMNPYIATNAAPPNGQWPQQPQYPPQPQYPQQQPGMPPFPGQR